MTETTTTTARYALIAQMNWQQAKTLLEYLLRCRHYLPHSPMNEVWQEGIDRSRAHLRELGCGFATLVAGCEEQILITPQGKHIALCVRQ